MTILKRLYYFVTLVAPVDRVFSISYCSFVQSVFLNLKLSKQYL